MREFQTSGAAAAAGGRHAEAEAAATGVGDALADVARAARATGHALWSKRRHVEDVGLVSCSVISTGFRASSERQVLGSSTVSRNDASAVLVREYRAIFDWFTSLASSANAPNIHAHEQDKVARSRSLLGESAPIQPDNAAESDGFCG